MKLISEYNDYAISPVIIEQNEKGEKEYYIEGVFMQSEIKNRNGRVYPKNIMEKEVGRYRKEFIEKDRAFGELGHPEGPTINLDRVSHLITSLEEDGDNYIGRAKILSTPNGQIVRSLISDGAKLGVSSRGLGFAVNQKVMHNMLRVTSSWQQRQTSLQTQVLVRGPSLKVYTKESSGSWRMVFSKQLNLKQCRSKSALSQARQK